MSTRWLILADDLTGAADAAVAFARRGHRTEVSWGAAPAACDAAVHSIDLASRGMPAAEAAACHRLAVSRRLEPGQSLFKKIDSTLRGQPAAEIAAIGAALRELGRTSWGLLAPANPAMRRTTRDGRVFVAGMPLEQSDTWKREHGYADADLAAIVRSAGLRATKLPLAVVRGEDSALHAAFRAAAAEEARGTALVCDAETDDDLNRLVAAAGACMPGFFIGTAGLANALSNAAPALPKVRTALGPSARGTLVAVGTLARVSRESASRLAARAGMELVRVGAAAEAVSASSIASRLRRGETAVALLEALSPDGHGVDASHAQAFAETLALALPEMGALIVTGGETAAALLARCRVHGIRLLDEIEPGIALGLTRGDIEVPIITKPGAFGDEDTLARCLDTLTELRRTA